MFPKIPFAYLRTCRQSYEHFTNSWIPVPSLQQGTRHLEIFCLRQLVRRRRYRWLALRSCCRRFPGVIYLIRATHFKKSEYRRPTSLLRRSWRQLREVNLSSLDAFRLSEAVTVRLDSHKYMNWGFFTVQRNENGEPVARRNSRPPPRQFPWS